MHFGARYLDNRELLIKDSKFKAGILKECQDTKNARSMFVLIRQEVENSRNFGVNAYLAERSWV